MSHPDDAPLGQCMHGTEDYGMLRARTFCSQCKAIRRESAKKAAKTRKARGTQWARSFISDHYQTWTVVPSWLAVKHEDRGDWVMVNDRIVYSPDRSPVWVVDVQTYRLAELLDLDRLKELLAGRVVLGNGDEPLFDGLASMTIAPHYAIEGGESLELYGLASAPRWRATLQAARAGQEPLFKVTRPNLGQKE